MLAALAGCGGGDDEQGSPPPASAQPAHAPPAERDGGRPELDPVRCPPAAAGCRNATGEIVYVERVDPDGDGDAHFVLLSDEDITGPGVSVVDVAAELRPRPLPGPGDLLSAAGPVRTGSYGQRQIEATEIRVWRID